MSLPSELFCFENKAAFDIINPQVGKEQGDDEEELEDKEPLIAQSYVFREGNKYREYRSTMFVTMTNGMAISSGLNGDMQMWDIATCEYEGNLYHDPTVKVCIGAWCSFYISNVTCLFF